MEHRCGERFRVEVPVRVTFGSRPHTGQLENVSLSGAYLTLEPGLREGTCIEVELCIGAPQRFPYRLRAMVVRTTPEGVGIEWEDFAPHAIKVLLGMSLRAQRTVLRYFATAKNRSSLHPRSDGNTNWDTKYL